MIPPFQLCFSNKSAAEQATATLREEGFVVHSWQSWDSDWFVEAESSMDEVDPETFESRMETLAASLGGTYDGFSRNG